MTQPIDFASRLQHKTAEPIDFAARLRGDTPEDPAAQMFGQMEFGPGGKLPTRVRAALAAVETLPEKNAMFRRFYPQGKIERVPVHDFLVAQTDPSELFAPIEGPKAGPDFAADVAEAMVGDSGSMIGEIAATATSRGLLGFFLRAIVGSTIGELAQEGAERAVGASDESVSGAASRGAGKGVVGGLTGIAMAPFVGVANVAGGRGLLSKTEQGKAAEVAAEALEGLHDPLKIAGIRVGTISALTPSQVTDFPLIGNMETQAAVVLPAFKRYYAKQKVALSDNIKGIRDEAALRDLHSTVEKAHNKMRADLLANSRKVSMEDGGQNLIAGAEAYLKSSGEIVDGLYEVARSIETPAFDLDPLRAAAAQQLRGIRARTEPKFTDINSGPTSRQIKVTEAERGVIAEIDDVAKEILEVDPSLAGADDATDILRAWRTRLFDLKTPDPGAPARAHHHKAGKMYDAITDTLNNPVGGSRQFTEAWQAANREAAKRHSTLELSTMVATLRSDKPAELAMKYARPGKVDALKVLRREIPAKNYRQFQDAFKTQLLENADDLTRTMQSFDKETLDLLLKPGEANALRLIGKRIDRLNLLDVNGALTRQTKNAAVIEDMVWRNLDDTAAIDSLLQMVSKNGGPSSPTGRAVRAGMVDTLVDRVLREESDEVASQLFFNEIRRLRRSGASKLLTKNDLETLGALGKLIPVVRQAADVGSSIAAMGTASSVRGVFTGDIGAAGKAALTLIEHTGVGRAYLSPWGRFILIGNKGKDPEFLPLLRGLGGALAMASTDLESTPDLEQKMSEK